MKIVLSWVFDHINAPFNAAALNAIDINDLTKQLTQKTTEIESIKVIKRDAERFALAQIKKVESNAYICVNHQGASIKLPKDTAHVEGDVALIYYEDDRTKWRFASSYDLGSSRHFTLPALHVDESSTALLALFESDAVLEIDNNAIAHRPDLWSHRGFAREIAAIYGFSLKPLESLVHQMKITTDSESVTATSDSPFSITLEDKTVCARFAGLYIKSIQSRKTTLDVVARLSLVDCKAIDMIVDCSNYVLYDIGQPIHTYDADLLTEKRVVVRLADPSTELLLLDGESIKLSENDIVVADGLTPVALAGIMGGMNTRVTPKTTSLFIESAHFDAYAVRQSASKHQRRTEAAIRFSRNIDPNNNVFGIMRYIKLLDQYKIPYVAATTVQSVGMLIEPAHVIVLHSLIEKRLGTAISPQRVTQLLNALGFDVERQGELYQITVPTSRSKRDISIPEDIVEEIGRLFGYATITPELPSIMTKPKSSSNAIRHFRALKNLLSFGFSMRELYNYSLFDESFLHKISYEPERTVSLKNPITSDRTRLVSTLLVHLLHAIHTHKEQHHSLRFFEIARCWQLDEMGSITEKEMLAGIMFDKSTEIDFYDGKQYVDRLFAMHNVFISYKTVQGGVSSLFDPIKSAAIYYQSSIVGYCGMTNTTINHILFDGKTCFMFELDAKAIALETRDRRYQEISKFPAVIRDISLFLSHQETAEELINMVRIIDNRIRLVEVVDFFEKKEWGDKRALTLRIMMQDNEKTLASDEVDSVIKTITAQCEKRGIQIR